MALNSVKAGLVVDQALPRLCQAQGLQKPVIKGSLQGPLKGSISVRTFKGTIGELRNIP